MLQSMMMVMVVVVAMMVIVIMVVLIDLQKLLLDVEEYDVEVEGAAFEHVLDLHVAFLGPVQPRIGVDGADAPFELLQFLRGDQIGLVEQDDVGESDLFSGLRMSSRCCTICLESTTVTMASSCSFGFHFLVGEERLRDRGGVGQAGRFDEDVVELVLAFEEFAEDADEVAAHGAADAAVVHLEDFFLGSG